MLIVGKGKAAEETAEKIWSQVQPKIESQKPE